MEYARVVWDLFYKKTINELEQISRLAVRFIYNSYNRHDCPSELILTNEISSFEYRRKLAKLKF